MKKLIEDTTTSLDSSNEEYELIDPDGDRARFASEWLEKTFPIASWGRIDWDKLSNHLCVEWDDVSDLSKSFSAMCGRSKLSGTVFVMWSNKLKPMLEINIDTVVKYADIIFEEDWDTWICGIEQGFCVEVYHEGDLCLAFKPIGSGTKK